MKTAQLFSFTFRSVGGILFHTFPPGDEFKFGRHQRIQAYVNQVEAGLFQLGQKPGQVHAVGCHRNGFQAVQLPQLGCRENNSIFSLLFKFQIIHPS